MTKLRKVGVLFPSHNPTVEPDFHRAMPRDVIVLGERMWMPPDRLPGEPDLETNADLERASRYVARSRPELIVYACTGGSFTGGPDVARQICDRIKKETGVSAFTTATALVEGAKAMGLKRVSVMSPYSDSTNTHLKAHLEYHGITVLNIEGEPYLKTPGRDPAEIGLQDPEHIVKFVTSVARRDADGVVLSCTAWRSLEVADEIERRLGKPVVTSNMANVWLALRHLGINTPVKSYGRLLAGAREAVAAT